MRILSASVKNFGSYKELSFGLTDRELTLISGPTGSGKSTLCDIIPWVLWGRTAKDGAADDVLSWNTTGVTEGSVEIRVPSEFSKEGTDILRITRVRGGKSNDLYWFRNTVPSSHLRGKDLNDTQKLINNLLGLTVETYLAGAYFHEFSQTAQFFITSAKNRRIITEQLADLTLAKKLQENSSSYLKELKEELNTNTQKLALSANSLNIIKKNLEAKEQKALAWNRQRDKQAVDLEHKALSFESIKEQTIKDLTSKSASFETQQQDKIARIQEEIQELEASLLHEDYFHLTETNIAIEEAKLEAIHCSECGALKDSTKRLTLTKKLHELEKKRIINNKIWADITSLNNMTSVITKAANPYIAQIERAENQVNDYLDRLEVLSNQENPHRISPEEMFEPAALADEVCHLKETLEDLRIEKSDIELLEDVVKDFRGSLISRTVEALEISTNKLLEDHFDAEIRVTFSSDDADKIDVNIMKDGNECSYTQLSKGQRQILKLCFGVSTMGAVSNYSGVSFNTLWFDEATDGLSDPMKLKALGMLEMLALDHESVFLVEHSEAIKAMINNKIELTLENGSSRIDEN